MDRIHSKCGDFLVGILGKEEDVKMPSGGLAHLNPSQLRWIQEICKLPEKSAKASSPGLGMVGLGMCCGPHM